MADKHYVIVFDIFDNRRRRQVVKILENYTYRIQYSVFAVQCDELKIQRLVQMLGNVIEEETDSIFVFPMITMDWKRTVVLGQKTAGLQICTSDYLIV